MRHPELVKILEEQGLKERHAKIYLALLSLGSASVQAVSKKSGFARSTCEAVLAMLQRGGFASTYKKKKIKWYSAEDPDAVIKIAEHKMELLKNSLPKFLDLYGSSDTFPSFRFYEDVTGMRIILNEMLSEAKNLRGLGSADHMYGTLLDHLRDFIKERIRRKIPMRLLLQESSLAYERQKLERKNLMSVRIIPKTYNCTSMMYVWNKKIAMFSLQKDIVVLVIESEELAILQKAMFELIWKDAEV